MNAKTRKLTITGMLCALAYGMTAVGRVPIVLFLKYDPKDIVIAIGGLLFGPMTSLAIAGIVSFAEMLTISENGIWGLIMNVISSCCFACTAAFIYKKKHSLSGAVIGLLIGWGCMVPIMLLWNYLIAPIYLGYPKEAVAALLLPAFLPFNLIKGGLNAVITMLLYKPIVTTLEKRLESSKVNYRTQIRCIEVNLHAVATSINTIFLFINNRESAIVALSRFRAKTEFCGLGYSYRKVEPPVTIQQAMVAAVSAPGYTLPVRR